MPGQAPRDEVTILPFNQPYTGHLHPFASVKAARSYTEVKTYPDGILVTRHDEYNEGKVSTAILPWEVIEALLPHHHAALAHASRDAAEKAAKTERTARAKATRARKEREAQERDYRIQDAAREGSRHADDLADGAASLADPMEE